MDAEQQKIIDRQNKIIVALFLILGRTMTKIPISERPHVYVTEDEIAEAWKKKKSPVRLLSSMEHVQPSAGFDEAWTPGGQRVFRVVPGDLDLSKTGMKIQGKMPLEAEQMVHKTKERRVFDLE